MKTDQKESRANGKSQGSAEVPLGYDMVTVDFAVCFTLEQQTEDVTAVAWDCLDRLHTAENFDLCTVGSVEFNGH
ncbi:uncharacterized protein V6R79_025079 [Siganus canaliculatus]